MKIFLFVSSSVQGSLLYCLFLDVPHKQHSRMSSFMSNEKAIFPCLRVLSSKHSHSTVLLKNRSVFENSARKCVSERCGFMVSDRTMGPVILVEMYSTPTLTSWNGTAWGNMGCVADQYLLFEEFLYSLNWQHCSLLNLTSVFLHHTHQEGTGSQN
jgi:hypothetical protein